MGKSLPQNERQQVFPNGTLVIKEADEQDSGGYVCVASNPDGLTSRSKLNVQVMEPPEIHPFTVKPNLQRGMRIHLTCVVIRGDFPITFHWLKDGADLPQDSGITEKTLDEYSSTLAISRLAAHHSGNYTCTAANAVATARHTAEVVVSVPPSWKTEPQDAEAVEGENLTIPCSASGTPTPKISWKRRDAESSAAGTEEMHSSVNYGVLENGSLWIANVTAEHAGSYGCEASTDASSTLSKTVRLTWRREGSPFDARRQPRWALSEQPLQAGLRSALTLTGARRHDSAGFECRASNRYGSDLRRMRLVVQEPPEVPAGLTVLAVSSRAANLTWQQPYDGNSPILEYIVQYKTGNGSWQQGVSQVSTPGGRTWASVTSLLPGRRYEVRVLARNILGLSKAPSTPGVALDTAQEPPGAPPTHLSVLPQDSQTLLVEWKPPDGDRHGDVLGYRVEFWQVEAPQQRQRRTLEAAEGAPSPLRLRLEALRKATQYAVRVRAYNAAGDGPPGTEVLAATAEDVPEVAPLGVQCVAASPQSLLVEWEPPPENKLNGRLLGYRLFYRPLAEWDDVSAPSEISTQDTKLEVTGLLRFCNYSLEVRAYTAAGDGVPSEPVFCRTWEDVPSPPDDIKAVVMDTRTILLSWKPPAFPNGVIRKYKIYIRSLDGAALHRDEFEAPAGQTHYGLSHLAPLHRYEMRVTAATAAGEGAPSRPVVQAPSDQVPARVASFGGVVHAARGSRLSLPCLTVGRPRPAIVWTHGERPVQASQRLHVDDEWTLHIEGAQPADAGNYSCRAENRLGSDSLLYTVTVHEVRNKDIPSTPEDFHVSSTTISSITLAWRLPEGGKKLAAITDYCLHYKREFGEWEKIKIPGTETSFTLGGLQCGAKYLLYLQAEGRRGDSHPTDTIAARTQGAAPEAPPQSELLVVNATRVSLVVSAWRTGGCAISTLVVEYRRWDRAGWTLVSNSVPHADAPFSVLDLRPATRYLLRLTAHNSAGSTVALYDFVTLDDETGVVAPELIVQAGWTNGHFWRNPAIIVTLIAVLVAFIVAGVVLFSYLRRKRERFPAGRKESASAEGEEVAGLGEKASYVGGNGVLSRHCRSHSDLQQQQHRTQLALQPLHHQAARHGAGSATPSSAHLYATFRLAEERRLRWQQDELGDPREHHQLELQTEPQDWAPLRSLHLAHKY
ncbi:Down syndrome cell adhesion molecule-like protein Dscam2 [Schistocerca nitens]|uniref:Down syndrome cell adhesion molecule-like protein Dscam2 n=1 Tax=Schistocerca nitens TaxID=7011 RepID=UPI002117B6F8|nr:Down syndrome cell adhesion molecule-like protein Dscam2 [Schistocerca nitens]